MDRFDPFVKLEDINNPNAIDLDNDPLNRFDPFNEFSEVYKEALDWEKDPMNKPWNQNKYFFSDGKTYYEQICKMLRLMSVFKQAFNQIYDNEDEIHTAWENFVDNLSATAVYGEEVGVNLTWTDTSVNFAFTIPGGQDGVGIQSITFNSDYTMTITLTDGSTYTSTSLRGPQGEQGIQGLQGPTGPQGEPGSGLEILDVYPTLQDLQTAHPTGSPGDAYQVGTAPNFTLYIWSASQSAWVSAGRLGSVSPSSADPLMDGIASPGVSDLYARGDHVHPTDTSRASTQDLQTVDERVDDISDIISTSQKLIDQSFVYRESPAEHDGLAVLDKIKGNTLVWNQLKGTPTGLGTVAGTTVAENSDGSITITGTATGIHYVQYTSNEHPEFQIKGGHKYFYRFTGVSDTVVGDVYAYPGGTVKYWVNQLKVNSYGIFEPEADSTAISNIRLRVLATFNGTATVNFFLCDLTLMGLDNLTADEFVSFFPLVNYAFTPQPILLSFNGTGLKTTGKNLFNRQDTTIQSNGVTYDLNDDGSYTVSGTPTGYSFVNSYCNVNNSMGVITISGFNNATNMCCDVIRLYDSNNTMLFETGINSTSPITIDLSSYPTVTRMAVGIKRISNNVAVSGKIYFQMEFGNQATAYEPYTENTLSLPISTYFPTGMKEAGNVYDEISDKAYTRVGSVDLGTLDWSTSGTTDASKFRMISDEISSLVSLTGRTNIVCSVYETKTATETYSLIKGIAIDGNGNIVVYDENYNTLESPSAFKTAMSGVMLYYELATPTEQDIDLDLSFKAYEGGTEQLLPVNGSVPTTSSLLADMTYFSINDAMDYILAKLDQVHSSTTSDINSLKTRMTSAEGDIADLDIDLEAAEENITSLGGRMTTAEGNISSNTSRISELETDLFKIEVKEVDFTSASGGGNFGTTRQITVEEGYSAIGIVGTEAQAGTATSPHQQIAITQCHVHYSSENNLILTLYGRNNFVDAISDIRLYAYVLCMKDIQSE